MEKNLPPYKCLSAPLSFLWWLRKVMEQSRSMPLSCFYLFCSTSQVPLGCFLISYHIFLAMKPVDFDNLCLSPWFSVYYWQRSFGYSIKNQEFPLLSLTSWESSQCPIAYTTQLSSSIQEEKNLSGKRVLCSTRCCFFMRSKGTEMSGKCWFPHSQHPNYKGLGTVTRYLYHYLAAYITKLILSFGFWFSVWTGFPKIRSSCDVILRFTSPDFIIFWQWVGKDLILSLEFYSI